MGPWKPQYTIALIVAGLLACSISYYVGKKQGVIDERLSINATEIKKSDENIKSVSAAVDTAKKHSDILAVYRGRVRAKIGVQHDTITVHTQNGVDSTQYVSPDIAQLIEADDSTIAAQARTIALQDSLISSLRVGLNLRDERIGILEKEKQPLLGLKSGVVIGAGVVIAILFAAHR